MENLLIQSSAGPGVMKTPCEGGQKVSQPREKGGREASWGATEGPRPCLKVRQNQTWT